MCHRLYLASPLTLSEVRAMLPFEVEAAAAAVPVGGHRLRRHPVTLAVRGCACALFLPGPPAERIETLRRSYRERKHGDRLAVAESLDDHRRRGVDAAPPSALLRRELDALLRELARNARELVVTRHFGWPAHAPSLPHDPDLHLAADALLDAPGDWLPECRLVRLHYP